MGQKSLKRGHRASKAVDESRGDSKEKILGFYSELEKKSKLFERKEIPGFSESNEQNINVPKIREELDSRDPDIVLTLLKSIEHIAETRREELTDILPTILRISKINSDERVRYEAVKVLSKLKDVSTADDLVEIISNDSSEKVREAAVKAIGFIKAGRYFDLLVDIVNDIWNQSIRVRRAAAFSIGHIDHKASAEVLCDRLANDPDMEVRKEAAESLSVTVMKLEKNKAAAISNVVKTSIDYENEAEEEVRISAINVLTVSENMAAIDDLIVALKRDPNPRVRGQAANSLSHFFEPRIEKALIDSLNHEEGGTKKRIALAIAHYAMKNPLGLHDEMCNILIYVQKLLPRGSYIWKEVVKALPAC